MERLLVLAVSGLVDWMLGLSGHWLCARAARSGSRAEERCPDGPTDRQTDRPTDREVIAYLMPPWACTRETRRCALL